MLIAHQSWHKPTPIQGRDKRWHAIYSKMLLNIIEDCCGQFVRC